MAMQSVSSTPVASYHIACRRVFFVQRGTVHGSYGFANVASLSRHKLSTSLCLVFEIPSLGVFLTSLLKIFSLFSNHNVLLFF